jgi:hypothetical protein
VRKGIDTVIPSQTPSATEMPPIFAALVVESAGRLIR